MLDRVVVVISELQRHIWLPLSYRQSAHRSIAHR